MTGVTPVPWTLDPFRGKRVTPMPVSSGTFNGANLETCQAASEPAQNTLLCGISSNGPDVNEPDLGSVLTRQVHWQPRQPKGAHAHASSVRFRIRRRAIPDPVRRVP